MKIKEEQRAFYSLGLFLLSVSIVFIAFFPSSPNLLASWQTDEYSHGVLIPFIAVLMGWHRLTERRPVLTSQGLGLGVLCLGFLLLIFSRLAAFEPPAHYGFIVALIGLVLTFFGRGAVAALAPAFTYLLFAIPLPRLVHVGLSADLQLLSSTLGVFLLNLLDISVFQEGNIIDLGGHKLQVVEACNGLRYLFPLMSFGFLVAFLLEDKLWKRIALFVSTVPIAILMNALRIAIIGLTVDRWGGAMAEGLLHDLEGWTVFAFCMAVLFAEMWVLMRVGGGKGRFRAERIGLPRGPVYTGPLPRAVGFPVASFVLCAAFSGFLLSGVLDQREETPPPHPPFMTFPLSFGAWQGRPESMGREMLEALHLSDYWMAAYRREGEAASVTLYLAYYASQRVGSTIHSPANCLPGSGWRIEKKTVMPVDAGGQTIPVTRLLIREGQQALLVYYWFAGRGRIINEQYGAKWYLLIDSLTKSRTDGALVRFTTPLGTQETEQNADRRMQDLLILAYPSIQRFVP